MATTTAQSRHCRKLALRGRSTRRALLWFALVPFLIGAGTAKPSTGAVASQPQQIRPSLDSDRLALISLELAEFRERYGIPGIAAGIVHGEEVVLLEAIGEIGSGGGDVAPDTPFAVASLTKSMTALAVMQLVDSGALSLDAPVSEYLPEVGPAGRRVSVRDLAHHRSGLSRPVGVEPMVAPSGESLEDNVARLAPLLRSDAAVQYSNANYDALALIVERASNLSFEQYLQRFLFEPLAMDRTFMAKSRAADVGFARGHYHTLFLGYRRLDLFPPAGMAGSAGVFSSADDMTHLLIAHLNGGSFRGKQVLSQSAMEVLQTPPAGAGRGPARVVGWVASPAFPPSPATPDQLSNLDMLSHDGTWPTYRSVMWIVPEADVGFVVLANGNDVTDETLLPQLSRNVRLLLFDQDPLPVTPLSEPLRRWSKELLLVVVLGQVSLAVASIPILVRLRRRTAVPLGGRLLLGVATVVDIVAAVAVLWIIPNTAEAPLSVAMSLPDLRLLIGAMIVAITWGIIRTVLIVHAAASRRHQRPALAPP